MRVDLYVLSRDKGLAYLSSRITDTGTSSPLPKRAALRAYVVMLAHHIR